MAPVTRTLKLNGHLFEQVPLRFADDRRENVFADKNNKTVRETLVHRRYQNLTQACTTRYSEHLDSRLGDFLLQLKRSGDPFYQEFLNPYGDLVYSTFCISDLSAL